MVYLARRSGEPRLHGRNQTDTGAVMRRILAGYEAGNLTPSCAWCKRVELDGEWILAPRTALTAIYSPRALSHSICPRCAADLQAASTARRQPTAL